MEQELKGVTEDGKEIRGAGLGAISDRIASSRLSNQLNIWLWYYECPYCYSIIPKIGICECRLIHGTGVGEPLGLRRYL